MKRHCLIFLLFAFTAILFSCNFEKRLYRSGYYVSSPRSGKKYTSSKPAPDLAGDKRSRDENEDPATFSGESATANRKSETTLDIAAEQKDKVRKGNRTAYEQKVVVQNKERNKQRSVAANKEDEKIKKDVRGLLIGSVAVFVAAFLYELFLSSGVLWLANTLFILTPFAIIAIWIFALLLHQKYSNEEQSGSVQKPKQERIITRRKAFLLAGFLGIFGAHRFYLGYTEIAILEMLTLGGFFVLWFIDLLRIKNGKLKPEKGDYDREDINYKKGKVKKAPNRSQKLIKLAVLISLAALMIILGFAIFF